MRRIAFAAAGLVRDLRSEVELEVSSQSLRQILSLASAQMERLALSSVDAGVLTHVCGQCQSLVVLRDGIHVLRGSHMLLVDAL